MRTFNAFRRESVSEEIEVSSDLIEEINEKLETLSETDSLTPETFIVSVTNLLETYGISLQYETIHEEYGDDVFELAENTFLNIAYTLEEDGNYIFLARIMDSDELSHVITEEDEDGEGPSHFEISESLLIKLMEYAREEIKDDLTIHKIVDKMNALNVGNVFTADDYEELTKKI